MTPDEIANAMTGKLRRPGEGDWNRSCPRPWAEPRSLLHRLEDGSSSVPWFGGTLEGNPTFRSSRSARPRRRALGEPQRLSFDAEHSEQNPVLFTAADGRLWLFHTSQPSGNQTNAASGCRNREGCR